MEFSRQMVLLVKCVFMMLNLVISASITRSQRLDRTRAAYCEQTKGRVEHPRNCMDLLCQGYRVSGVYTVYPLSLPRYKHHVFCDQTTDGGGWLVFQRRMDGSVEFYRNWLSYAMGFGSLSTEFWLGLDKLSALTSNGLCYELRVDIESSIGDWKYAHYSVFSIADDSQKYKLTVANYTGTAGDSLTFHDGMFFSTYDRDNDAEAVTNCAKRFTGAWWYKDCHASNLNGHYYGGDGVHVGDYASGVNWIDWGGYYISFKTTEMKIRPLN